MAQLAPPPSTIRVKIRTKIVKKKNEHYTKIAQLSRFDLWKAVEYCILYLNFLAFVRFSGLLFKVLRGKIKVNFLINFSKRHPQQKVENFQVWAAKGILSKGQKP